MCDCFVIPEKQEISRVQAIKSRVSLLEMPSTSISPSYTLAYLIVGIALILLITVTLNRGLDYFRKNQKND
jgi:hypothetical protein